MTPTIFPRILTRQDRDRTIELSSDELSSQTDSLVILGEAGMGKTTLLRTLAEREGLKPVNAVRLAVSREPKRLIGDAKVVFVDAVDEAAATMEGEAVDRVLAALEEAGHPRFVLACRIADWRSATATERISEIYGKKPLELYIKPLDTKQAREFLATSLPSERAEETVDYFEARNLAGWLGNPQTLTMIARVAREEALPETSGELFSRFVDLIWNEHSDHKTDNPLNKTTRGVVLDSLGAAFAALILSGKTALTRLPMQRMGKDDLAISEVRTLPGADELECFLDSRLVSAVPPDRFTYQHRRIGEYLGARWLAARADTPAKRRRLFSMFRERGVVPASLRGMHAWLALDSALAADVITADPMGVIEYGDADHLTVGQGKALITALESLAARNPWFKGWEHYRISGISKLELVEDIRRLITSPTSPFSLRILILEAISNSKIADKLNSELYAMMLDANEPYAARSVAAKSVSQLGIVTNWADIGEKLRVMGDHDSHRLAVELFRNVEFSSFNDVQIVEIVCAQVGATLSPWPQQEDTRVAGIFIYLTKMFPDSRLDDFLETLTNYADQLVDRKSVHDYSDLADLTMGLIERRIGLGSMSGAWLWRWLAPYDEGVGYDRHSRRAISEELENNSTLRREIQKHVLLGRTSHKDLFRRHFNLTRRCATLRVTPDDAVELLNTLNPADRRDDRWREVVELVRHHGEEGAEVREAARRFAENRSDLLRWLDELASPRMPDWQVKQERKQLAERAKRELRWREHRSDFAKNRAKLRAGEFGYVLPTAQAYLKLFNDIGLDKPAHERISEWLGKDLQADAFVGFEAFLTADPPNPTAEQMAESFANNSHWNAGYVLVAALAERLRIGRGFRDLPDERLIAGRLELQHGMIDQEAGIEGLREAIEHELRKRKGAWEHYYRLSVEPSLRTQQKIIFGLHELMHSPRDASLATRLAIEWLETNLDIPADPEETLLDRVVRSGATEQLRVLQDRGTSIDDPNRRQNWDTIALLTDFEKESKRLRGIGERDRNFLWSLRDRFGANGRNDPLIKLSPQLISWTIREFRAIYSIAAFPSGGWSGNTNPWDASQFLIRLINLLANDTSNDAIRELAALEAGPTDSYTEQLKVASAEQHLKRADIDYRAPTIAEIANILSSGKPQSVKDLQAVMLEELSVAQRKLKSNDVDTRRDFFATDMVPHGEERCRDRLVGLLRESCVGVELIPELHVAADKEVDISCSVDNFRLPIEIKGQWHRELWNAADHQLDRLYATDWRAEHRGIYLVLWFGQGVAENRKIKSPPRGTRVPQSAAEMKTLLTKGSKAAREGRIEIFVLDLTRPQ